MTSLPRHRASRLTALLLSAVAACAVGLFGGASARASCGDWLEGHGPMDASSAHAVAPASGQATDALPFHLPGKRPCNGPSCGRAPHQPLAPSESPTTPLDLERDAILVLSHVDAPIAPRPAWAIDDLAPLPAFSGRLDRPPRGA